MYTKEFECGCKIKIGDGIGTASIEYCPKHKSAPDLYEALTITLKNLDDGFANKNLGIKTMIKQALAKAKSSP